MNARADKNLAFLLKYENVAWYESGTVSILDRRVYPMQTKHVVCDDYRQVAQAIADMVTQSAGPYTAAAMGMALAAWQAKDLPQQEHGQYMRQASYDLSHARPTTMQRMVEIVVASLDAMNSALAAGHTQQELPDILANLAVERMNKNYEKYEKVGRYLADLIPDGGTVMTQCYGETVVGMLLRACRESNKSVRFICPETRPYLQGARLTASVISDMGFEVHLITDNMPGYILKEKSVSLFTSAADVITMDGYVVNKVGTFQIALAAHHWGIPYFVTGSPNQKHPDINSVNIEERDPEQVLSFMGIRTAKPEVGAYYPAFDITPPTLCSGVVTDKGVFSPLDLHRYYK